VLADWEEQQKKLKAEKEAADLLAVNNICYVIAIGRFSHANIDSSRFLSLFHFVWRYAGEKQREACQSCRWQRCNHVLYDLRVIAGQGQFYY
jgi:hypothetical protein